MRLLNKITDMLADAALEEMGIHTTQTIAKERREQKLPKRTSSK